MESLSCTTGEYSLIHSEPKRPPAAYFLYVQEECSKHKANSGQADVAKIQKDWEKIDASTRASFQEKASSLKAAYEIQNAEYR